MKVVYDVIQRFELVAGVPCLISTNIKLIEGGESLMAVAQTWLEENSTLNPQVRKDYIGYRALNEKKYQVILAQRAEGLQISFIPNDLLKGEQDKLFPYANRILALSKSEVINTLERIF